jgi:hypothetical protein
MNKVSIIGFSTIGGKRVAVVEIDERVPSDFNLYDRNIENAGFKEWIRDPRPDEMFPDDPNGIHVRVLRNGGANNPSVRIRRPLYCYGALDSDAN